MLQLVGGVGGDYNWMLELDFEQDYENSLDLILHFHCDSPSPPSSPPSAPLLLSLPTQCVTTPSVPLPSPLPSPLALLLA